MKICFISENPETIGGLCLFQRNLVKYLRKKIPSCEITWIHRSDENEEKTINGVKYIGMKLPRIFLIKDIVFNSKVKRFLNKNYFDIVNSHAIWGYWMRNYKKKKGQRIVNTYHGLAVSFYGNHFKRFSLLKKILFSPLMAFAYIIEKPPMKKADAIICVSDKVRREAEKTYGKRKNIFVIRTGVDLRDFKIRNKKNARKELKLNNDKFYGLYVGKGGYWTKGLDRAINLGKEIYKRDKKFRLILIGPDYNKVKHLLNEPFIIFLNNVPREKMPLYYSATDIFFCMSRCEGGAPIMVVSEAMASGCFIVYSNDSEQEVIENGKNGLIIKDFDEKDAKTILDAVKNEKIRKKIIKNSIDTIKNISIEKWGDKYMEVLTNGKV